MDKFIDVSYSEHRVKRLRSVNLNLMLVFYTLYNKKSLTGAAECLHVSQPAVSHSLKKLRERFDDQLFLKAENGMIPTGVARDIYKLVDRGLKYLDLSLIHNEGFFENSSCREFRLGITDDLSYQIQRDVLDYTIKNAPNVSFNILPVRIPNEGAAQNVIEENKLDASISLLDSTPRSIGFDFIFEDELGCVGDPVHYGEREFLSLDQFVKAPHIALSHREENPMYVNKNLSKAGFSRRIIAKTPHIMPLKSLIPGTDALSVITYSTSSLLCQDGSLKYYQLPFKMEPLKMFLLWDPSKEYDPGLMWLRELLVDIIKEKLSGD